MITKDKLEIYTRYNGDIDDWIHAAKNREIRTMDGRDWHEIGEMLRGITLMKQGLASPEFVSKIKADVETKTSDQETAVLLMKLA